jgi:hypothetical protein
MNETVFYSKVLYDPRMARIEIIKNSTTLLSYELPVFCINNTVCDEGENYLSCPSDCLSFANDSICNTEVDGGCDPDCLKGSDPDCLRRAINIPLRPGWNLISIPIKLNNRAIGSVFSRINFSVIIDDQYYYINQTHNNFNTINESKGYWLKSLNNQTLTLRGIESSSKNITLNHGWNLISYPSLNRSLINETLKEYNYSVVYEYNSSWSSYAPGRIQNNLRYFTPGYGYWVNIY